MTGYSVTQADWPFRIHFVRDAHLSFFAFHSCVILATALHDTHTFREFTITGYGMKAARSGSGLDEIWTF